MSKRSIPEINAGSMADIAFLLLIFFLVTTTLETDIGISVILPPPLDKFNEPHIGHQRNVLEILINDQDKLLVEKEHREIGELTEITRRFITNRGKDKNSSDSPKVAIVSLKNDRKTSYDVYIKVQNELKKAYNEIRNEESKLRYGKDFEDLDQEQKGVIKKTYPIKLSEAESSKKTEILTKKH